jgi:hypothetical protein
MVPAHPTAGDVVGRLLRHHPVSGMIIVVVTMADCERVQTSPASLSESPSSFGATEVALYCSSSGQEISLYAWGIPRLSISVHYVAGQNTGAD